LVDRVADRHSAVDRNVSSVQHAAARDVAASLLGDAFPQPRAMLTGLI
jgi:hypothetical protein